MPPFIPRRRSRRRSVSGRAVLFICGLIVTALLLGGLTQVSRQSGPFDITLNRSFAAEGSIVAAESNVTATTVRHLMATMKTQQRSTVQAALDSLVQQATEQSARAADIADSDLPAPVQAEFANVFVNRANAVSELRASIDGLLGMRPLPVIGSAAGSARLPATPTLLSSSVASDRIAAAGALLTRSDRQYAAVRRMLERAEGHAKLVASTWVTNAQQWQVGSVATEVDQVTSSHTLAATQRLVLRTIRLSPQVLPSPSGGATPLTSKLSPTRTLTVSVVLSDLGTVDEPAATVQFTLTAMVTGAVVRRTRTSALASGTSVAMEPVRFAVTPGHTYQLSVSVILPAAQTDVTQTSQTDDLEIAPST
jgi:hypothetical protein